MSQCVLGDVVAGVVAEVFCDTTLTVYVGEKGGVRRVGVFKVMTPLHRLAQGQGVVTVTFSSSPAKQAIEKRS